MPQLSIQPLSPILSALSAAQPFPNSQTLVNTHLHPLPDLRSALPTSCLLPSSPAQRPQILFSPWLPLIQQSQHLSPTSVHQILLSPLYVTTLLRAARSGYSTRHLNASDEEDLDELFPRTTIDGLDIDSLFSSIDSKTGEPRKRFLRLDPCSPKDSIYDPGPSFGQHSGKDGEHRRYHAGRDPVCRKQEIWQRLATSQRAVQGIEELRSKGEEVRIFLMPWREEVVGGGSEFRVFCPPDVDRPGKTKIAAVSQYVWFRASPIFEVCETEELVKAMVDKIFEGIEGLYGRIVGSEAMTREMGRWGFTFDVWVDVKGSGEVQLVELNAFGGETGCGSCLFNWLKDARVLYGCEKEVEFRILRDDREDKFEWAQVSDL
ncbi:MAG: hypothetical protein M1820_010640 [Bogoriella megaspora]|nr:MAG: hypothetical protein M1820_010640 [Bogoriella megaspora]